MSPDPPRYSRPQSYEQGQRQSPPCLEWRFSTKDSLKAGERESLSSCAAARRSRLISHCKRFYDSCYRPSKIQYSVIGEWQLCEITGWPDNHSADNLVGWRWVMGDNRRLIVINLSQGEAAGRVHARWDGLGVGQCRLVGVIPGTDYLRDIDEMESLGLFVKLGPWGFHFFEVHSSSAAVAVNTIRYTEDFLAPAPHSAHILSSCCLGQSFLALGPKLIDILDRFSGQELVIRLP